VIAIITLVIELLVIGLLIGYWVIDWLSGYCGPVQRREFLIVGGRAALGIGALSVSACSSRPSTAPPDPLLEALVAGWEAGIPRWLQETKMPAVSIAIIRGGRLAWQKAFGVKDTGTNEPVDITSPFAACSNTKPVFAYGVMKLCEKGVLSLDTPLTKYTRRRVTKDPRIELVTTRHVLSHTAGFPNWRQGKDLPIEFDPGSKFEYSGEGFSYLQSVVEEITRKPFVDFMRDDVLKPLGMTSSRLGANEAPDARHEVSGHDQDGKRILDNPMTPARRAEDMARYGAAAALYTTPSDYAKFLLEYLDPRPANAFRLNEASRKEMLRPQIKKNETSWGGLAWHLEQFDGSPLLFTHAGQNVGWYCLCAGSTERRSGLMVMLNGDNYAPFLLKLLANPSGPPVEPKDVGSSFAQRFFAA
jgi:CubicO group peptidase (beta-lactamase class C family)